MIRKFIYSYMPKDFHAKIKKIERIIIRLYLSITLKQENKSELGRMHIKLKEFFKKVKSFLTYINLLRKFLIKKYFYTINHKRLGLFYFYFSLVSAMSGAVLATAIRFEMAFPGSSFFNGDSLRYLQVITAHALIMIFFVVVPIFFGGFANFLLPYHVGSKDVAFPRLNSLGFWIQPCGYLLIAKIGYLRSDFWYVQDKTINYFSMLKADHYQQFVDYSWNTNKPSFNAIDLSAESAKKPGVDKVAQITLNREVNKTVQEKSFNSNILNSEAIPIDWLTNSYVTFYSDNTYKITYGDIGDCFTRPSWLEGSDFLHNIEDSKNATGLSWKLFFWRYIYAFPETFWFLTTNSTYIKRRKRYIVKCANASQTVAGWTFITPFSSKVKFTGVGIQDMLILGVYFAGISTTISLVNLLVTRRCLSMPGLRNRRILISFITISILLMFRALAVITPVLGSAMLMLALDRHWQTSFFDFAYGGDPIFFHHLFWFFGHPEVYVLVIPAFGVINAVIPTVNFRRVASKHHLVWAIYIMNYMGFLVWGHHMYLIGLDHRSRALYSTITIMISLPATIKVVNWTYTLVNGVLKKDIILISILSFIFFFLVAGFTGMWLSHVSLNISMHDTLYVVAHFHLMLSGAVIMGIFTGFYYYFTVFFQLKYSRNLAYLHLIYYTAGQWMTFLPLFWVSFSGLPRRLHDYPACYMGWQSMSTVGHLVTMVGVFAFYSMLFESHYEKKLYVYLHTIIARFNKRALYYLYKIIYLYLNTKIYSFLPSMKTQLYINNIKEYAYA